MAVTKKENEMYAKIIDNYGNVYRFNEDGQYHRTAVEEADAWWHFPAVIWPSGNNHGVQYFPSSFLG